VAIIFGLVMNFGDDLGAAEEAAHRVSEHPPLTADGQDVPLRWAPPSAVDSALGVPYQEVSVAPERVGWGVAGERREERLQLSAAEMTELGQGLYNVLGTLTGYRLAIVGWAPQSLVDLDELRMECAAELAAGAITGLVVGESVLSELPPCGGLRPFAPGYSWVPYRGERRGNQD
jgi:hypothetical protein